jgi:hypothetical protein
MREHIMAFKVAKPMQKMGNVSGEVMRDQKEVLCICDRIRQGNERGYDTEQLNVQIFTNERAYPPSRGVKRIS